MAPKWVDTSTSSGPRTTRRSGSRGFSSATDPGRQPGRRQAHRKSGLLHRLPCCLWPRRDLRPRSRESGRRRDGRRADRGRADDAACADRQHPPPPRLGTFRGDLRRRLVPARPLGLGFRPGCSDLCSGLRQALRGQQHREEPRHGHRADGRADAARDLRPSLRNDRPRRRRFLRHGGLQPGAGAPSGNALNCTQNKHLLTDILRTEFGFQGMVLSDWWAMPGGSSPSATQKTTDTAQAILAGLDIELPWNLNFTTLESLIPASIQQNDLTQAALHVVTEKYRFNVASLNGSVGLKTPTTVFNSGSFSITNNDAHIALAQQAAHEGMVLLKNDNNILPIKSDGSVKTVAVVGLTVPWTLQGVKASGTVDFPKDRAHRRPREQPRERRSLQGHRALRRHPGARRPRASRVVVDDSGGTAVAQDRRLRRRGRGPHARRRGRGVHDRAGRLRSRPEPGARRQAWRHGRRTTTSRASPRWASRSSWFSKAGSVIDVSSFVLQRSRPRHGLVPGPVGRRGPRLCCCSGRPTSAASCRSPGRSRSPTSPASAATGAAAATPRRCPTISAIAGSTTRRKRRSTPSAHGLSYSAFQYGNLQVPCSTVTPGGVVNVTVDVTNTGTIDWRRDRLPVRLVAELDGHDPRQRLQGAERVPARDASPPGRPRESRSRSACRISTTTTPARAPGRLKPAP